MLDFLKGREYKLCSVKLFAFVALVVLIMFMYHTIILYLTKMLTGDILKEMYFETLKYLFYLFLVFAGANLGSKFSKPKRGDDDKKAGD